MIAEVLIRQRVDGQWYAFVLPKQAPRRRAAQDYGWPPRDGSRWIGPFASLWEACSVCGGLNDNQGDEK